MQYVTPTATDGAVHLRFDERVPRTACGIEMTRERWTTHPVSTRGATTCSDCNTLAVSARYSVTTIKESNCG